jgi:hypothetical protein
MREELRQLQMSSVNNDPLIQMENSIKGNFSFPIEAFTNAE